MHKRVKAQLRLLLRSFWASLLIAIIAVAVVVQLGRAAFPILNDYKGEIAAFISNRVGAEVTFAELSAQWRGLTPKIQLIDLRVANDGEEVFSAAEVEVEWNLLATLRDWRAGLRKLRFQGFAATFEQLPSGQWRLQGLPAPSTANEFADEAPIIDDPVDIFVFGRRLELLDTRLTLKFRNATQTDIVATRIHLENDNRFHRLKADLSIAGEKAFALVVEGYGDPRNEEAFSLKGYLASESLDLDRLTGELRRSGLLPDAPQIERLLPSEGDVNLSLWFKGTMKSGVHFLGRSEVAGLRAPTEAVQWPASVSGAFRGYWEGQTGWQISLRDWRAGWQDHQTPSLDLLLTGGLGQSLKLYLPEVELAPWRQAVLRTRALPVPVSEALTALAPAGRLRHALLEWTDEAAGYFKLRGLLEAGAVAAWYGAPELAGVAGWVEADAWGGHIQLANEDAFHMHFPKIYDAPFDFESARGDIRWRVYPDEKWVGVSSGRLQLEATDFTARGFLNLRLPYAKQAGQEPEMTLVIGVEQAAALYHRLFVPNTAPEHLRGWLHEAVQGGVGHDIGFIYHGTLLKQSAQARVIQLTADVRSADLKFDPNWPALEQASGALLLDDEQMQVRDLVGTLAGSRIEDGQVRLLREQGQRQIRIDADARGASAQLLDFLLNSPAGRPIRDALASWQIDGDFEADVALVLPLSDLDNSRQDITVRLRDNSLRLPEPDLSFTAVTGALNYTDDRGLRAEALKAALWGQPVATTIQTQTAAGEQRVQIDMHGSVAMASLHAWLERPELTWAAGQAPFQVRLDIPTDKQSAMTLTAQSDLVGVELKLPEPLAKAAQTPLATRFSLVKYRDRPRSDYQLTLADAAHLQWRDVAGRWAGGALSFFEPLPELTDNSFLITGELAEVDGVLWFGQLQQYLAELEALASADTDSQSQDAAAQAINYQVELHLEALWLGPARFDNLQLNAQGMDNQWLTAVANANVKGRIRYLADEPLGLEFEYLRFPQLPGDAPGGAAPPAGERGLLRFFSPLDLPAADIDLKQVQLGETDYGQWRMKLRPVAGGVAAYDLFGNVAGVRIDGLGSDDDSGRGAELIWLGEGDSQMTYVNGRLTATDVGQAAEALLGEKIMTSSSANVDVQMQWPGAPDQIALTTVRGLVDLEIARGRFIRGATAAENPLVKLVGLFNFDTLARRLRLDFSDLNPEGMAYEKVAGRLLFAGGQVRIPTPLQVDTPSANMRFAGDIDLLEQELDTQLVATLPITGNLTVAAALTGGIPTAVTVYLLGKMFKKQVDRASSIRYNIDGNWADPDVSLDRIFETSTEDTVAQ